MSKVSQIIKKQGTEPSLTIWVWRRRKAVGTKGLLSESMSEEVFVEQPLALLGSAKKRHP